MSCGSATNSYLLFCNLFLVTVEVYEVEKNDNPEMIGPCDDLIGMDSQGDGSKLHEILTTEAAIAPSKPSNFSPRPTPSQTVTIPAGPFLHRHILTVDMFNRTMVCLLLYIF